MWLFFQLTLFISVGDTVTICHIKKRDPNESKAKDLPENMVEIIHKFSFSDQWVCGIAPMNPVNIPVHKCLENHDMNQMPLNIPASIGSL